MVESKSFKENLLKEISESYIFSENNIFQFCIDNDCDIGTVTVKVNELIEDNKIFKHYYCPYEERFAGEPIGNNSYVVLTNKMPKLNIQELMEGL